MVAVVETLITCEAMQLAGSPWSFMVDLSCCSWSGMIRWIYILGLVKAKSSAYFTTCRSRTIVYVYTALVYKLGLICSQKLRWWFRGSSYLKQCLDGWLRSQAHWWGTTKQPDRSMHQSPANYRLVWSLSTRLVGWFILAGTRISNTSFCPNKNFLALQSISNILLSPTLIWLTILQPEFCIFQPDLFVLPRIQSLTSLSHIISSIKTSTFPSYTTPFLLGQSINHLGFVSFIPSNLAWTKSFVSTSCPSFPSALVLGNSIISSRPAWSQRSSNYPPDNRTSCPIQQFQLVWAESDSDRLGVSLGSPIWAAMVVQISPQNAQSTRASTHTGLRWRLMSFSWWYF